MSKASEDATRAILEIINKAVASRKPGQTLYTITGKAVVIHTDGAISALDTASYADSVEFVQRHALNTDAVCDVGDRSAKVSVALPATEGATRASADDDVDHTRMPISFYSMQSANVERAQEIETLFIKALESVQTFNPDRDKKEKKDNIIANCIRLRTKYKEALLRHVQLGELVLRYVGSTGSTGKIEAALLSANNSEGLFSDKAIEALASRTTIGGLRARELVVCEVMLKNGLCLDRSSRTLPNYIKLTKERIASDEFSFYDSDLSRLFDYVKRDGEGGGAGHKGKALAAGRAVPAPAPAPVLVAASAPVPAPAPAPVLVAASAPVPAPAPVLVAASAPVPAPAPAVAVDKESDTASTATNPDSVTDGVPRVRQSDIFRREAVEARDARRAARGKRTSDPKYLRELERREGQARAAKNTVEKDGGAGAASAPTDAVAAAAPSPTAAVVEVAVVADTDIAPVVNQVLIDSFASLRVRLEGDSEAEDIVMAAPTPAANLDALATGMRELRRWVDRFPRTDEDRSLDDILRVEFNRVFNIRTSQTFQERVAGQASGLVSRQDNTRL